MVSVEPSILDTKDSLLEKDWQSAENVVRPGNETGSLLATFLTTAAVFGIYFCQGILIARILGPIGRGEFGTAMFFPRDVFLYVGLLGGLEVVARYSANRQLNANELKYSAATLGLFSGLVTAIVSAIVATTVLLLVNDGAKAYLIPYGLLVCLFVPWEHLHLTISGVDRGRESYSRYNINRLIFAASFPLLVLVAWLGGLLNENGQNLLLVVCGLFVVSRIIGLYPTVRGLKIDEWVASVKNKSWLTGAETDNGQPSARKLLRQGWPYALSMFATEVFERLDILLILALASVEDSGFYFVAIPAAALLTIAPNSLSVFTFNAGAERRYISLRKAFLVIGGTIVFQSVSLLVLWYLIPKLIVLFYGADFEPAIQFVWYLLPAFAIKGFLQAMDGYLKGCGRPMIGVWARCLSVLAMLFFVYFGYSKYELLSIPMAAFVGQALSMVIVTYFVVKIVAEFHSSRSGANDGDH